MAKSRWNPEKFRLFLSHTHFARRRAALLKKELQRYAVDVFLAHDDIAPTQQWEDEIIRALDSCDALAALLTKRFPESKWTDQEVGYCLRRGVLVLPLRSQIDPYGFMARYQGLNDKGRDASVVADEVFEVLISHKLTEDLIAGPVVRQFADSWSFANAKSNMDLLERLPRLTDEQKTQIRRALRNNRQVYESTGVPDRIKHLLKKHRE